jgi:flavin-dependent dehydrogenase
MLLILITLLLPGKDEQTYGLGIKEVWQVPPDKFKKGYIQHTLGWPLQDSPMRYVNYCYIYLNYLIYLLYLF